MMKHSHVKMLALLLSLSFLLVLAGCNSKSSSSGSSPGPVNVVPVANAGSDQHIKTGETISLDGSGSSDDDHDLLTYSWIMTSQPLAPVPVITFTGADTSHPVFSADTDGDYVFTLTVNDGTVDSSVATVTVTLTTQTTTNAKPVADGGGRDQHAELGATITLDGSHSSDADHDHLTYRWDLLASPDGSTVVLSGTNTPHLTFTADIEDIYIIGLKVNDGTVYSETYDLTVHVSGPNVAPVANAGPDQPVVKAVGVDLPVALDGSLSSDANRYDGLTFSWTTQSKPDASGMVLNGAGTSHPTFVADVEGIYVIKLIVDDGIVDSVADTVTVTVSLANVAPVANAGTDQHDKTGVLITLDGSGSKDDNTGDTLAFAWTVTSAPSASTLTDVTNPTTVNPTFVADAEGTYVIKLVVNDGTNDGSVNTDTDTVSVIVTTPISGNSAPVAKAGPDQLDVSIGSEASLDGTGSTDADGDSLTYSWSLQSHPGAINIIYFSSDQAQPPFTPDMYGHYVFKLIVNDGTVSSAADTVTLAAPPKCGKNGGACMFVTSTKHSADLKTAGNGSTGLEGADNICNERAQTTNLPGTYKAWLSAGSDSVTVRMAPYTLGPIKRLDGVLIADDWADLVSGSVQNSISLDEKGSIVVPDTDAYGDNQKVWTGTYPSGITNPWVTNCNNWTSTEPGPRGTLGNATQGFSTFQEKGSWTNLGDNNCTTVNLHRLYCLQQP